MPENIKELKMALIAGASHAIKFKEKNGRASEEDVIKHVSDNSDNIINKMDNPL